MDVVAWQRYAQAHQQDRYNIIVLMQATEPFIYNQFIVMDDQAERTVAMLKRCTHRKGIT